MQGPCRHIGQLLLHEAQTPHMSAKGGDVRPPVALQGRELPCPAADGSDGDPARFRPDVLGPGRGLRAPGQHQTPTHGDDAVPQLFQQGLHVVTRRHLYAEIFFGQGRTGQVGPATGQEHLLLLPGLAPLFPALLPPAGQGMGLPGGMFRLFRLLAPARFGPGGSLRCRLPGNTTPGMAGRALPVRALLRAGLAPAATAGR